MCGCASRNDICMACHLIIDLNKGKPKITLEIEDDNNNNKIIDENEKI